MEVIDKSVLYRERDAKLAYEKFEEYLENGDRVNADKMAWYLYRKHDIDVGVDGGWDIIGWSKNY